MKPVDPKPEFMPMRPDPTDMFAVKPDGRDLVITIDGSMPVYARGAMLLAILAKPPVSAAPKDLRPLRDAILSRCRLFFEFTDDEVTDGFPFPEQLDPRHLKFPLNKAELTERKTRKALDDRMGAAKAVYPLLAQTADPIACQFRNRISQATLAEGIDHAVQLEAERAAALKKLGKVVQPRFGTGIEAPVNFEARGFKASRPVLHLAVAVAEAMEQAEQIIAMNPRLTDPSSPLVAKLAKDASGPGGTVRWQLHHMWFQASEHLQELVIRRAMQVETYIRRLPRLRLDRIVKLRLGPAEAGTAPDA